MLLRDGSWGASGVLCACAGACGRRGRVRVSWRPVGRCRGVWAAGAVGERRGSDALGVPRASRWSRLCTLCGGARPRILERLLLCKFVPPRWTGTGSVMARVRGALAPQVRVPEVRWGADPLPGGGKDLLLESLMPAPDGRHCRTQHHARGFQMKNVRDIRRRDSPCSAPGRQPRAQSVAAPVPAGVPGAQARQWLGSGWFDGDGVLGVRVAVHVRQLAAGERS